MTELRRYQEQFERMKRWYERIRKINQGKPHNFSSDHYHDEVYAFFLNCYHLKDWIQNDDTVELPKEKVEDFINQNECMKVCADICNSIKHLKRESDRSGKDPEFGGRKFFLNLGGPKPIIKVKFPVMTKDGTIDVLKLASECIQKWEEFIKDNIS